MLVFVFFLIMKVKVELSFIIILIIDPGKAIQFNCSDEKEINRYYEEYKKSSSVLFSEYAQTTMFENVTEILQEAEMEATKDLLVTINDVLPKNKSFYLKRRPPSVCGHPARATYHVTVLSLDSINEASMTYSLDAYLTITWIDHRLRYPNSIRDYLILDPEWLGDVWQPDTIFKNARQVVFHERIIPNHYLWMLPNKGLIYVCKLTLTLTCRMNFVNYPHDTQECDLQMESMTYTDKELLFEWDLKQPISFSTKDKKITTPQFHLALHKTESCRVPYMTGSYTCIRAVFYLRRRLGYHLIHTYFPSGLIVVLSWVTFWIKPRDIIPRIALGVTSLLTLVTLNTQSQSSLPPVSYGKAIDTWMTFCAMFVFCSIIEYAIINYLVCRFPEDEACETELTNVKTIRDKMKAFFTRQRINAIAHNIDRFSRFLFPVCFVILNIWYWNKYLQEDTIHGQQVMTEN